MATLIFGISLILSSKIMKIDLLRIYLLYALLATFSIMGEGFLAGTLVCTPQGYVPIEQLSPDDLVVTCDFSWGYTVRPIVAISQYDVDQFIRINIDDISIDVDSNHAFLVPLEKKWMPVSELVEGTCLFGAPLNAVYLSSLSIIHQKKRVYNLSIADHAHYLVSAHNIIVHNFAEAGGAVYALAAAEIVKDSSILGTFLLANPLVAPVVISVGGVALITHVGLTFFNAIKESRSACAQDQKNKSKRDKWLKKKHKKSNNDQPPDDNNSRGAAAAALLKAIDESKEKAVEVFEKTCEWLVSDKGWKTMMHCFKDKPNHNFSPLLSRMTGNTRDIWTKVVVDVTEKLINMGTLLPIDSTGVFEEVLITYEGELITVQGIVMDNMVKISTMFIKDIHVR